jgi:hypothetical protein
MTSTNESLQVLPVDSRGRVRVSSERREALLAEFDRSGMTAAGFAAWAGIKYSTFASWIQQRRRKAGKVGGGGGGLRWVEAVVDKQNPAVTMGNAVLTVHLPAGARMEIADARAALLAAELLRGLSGLTGVNSSC